MNLDKLTTAELLKELEKRKSANVSDSAFVKKVKQSSAKTIKPSVTPQWVGKFVHEIPNQSTREKFAQYSTPPHIAEHMARMLTDDLDLKDQIIYEPFVGAGAMFLPLRNKGAVLVGSDIDLEALEICKQLVPGAILIHHDSVGCLEPQSNIKYLQNKISELKTKKLIPEISKKIEGLEKRIEEQKLRTPWRWGLYCVEHLIQEPKETFLRLTKILRDREIAKMRKEHNQGKEMFFVCSDCGGKEVDYQVCENTEGKLICLKCFNKPLVRQIWTK